MIAVLKVVNHVEHQLF